MPDVCLVVPCYNEAARLNGAAFLDYLARDPRVNLCFVDDGSTDGTTAMLAALAAKHPERIQALTLAQNSGKAEAVRQGMRHVVDGGAFTYAGYWDADLSTPLAELRAMVDVLDANPACVMALGSRWKRLGSRISRDPWRHVLGRVFATVASLTLRLPVYDSQCGAKVIRTAKAGALFAEPFITRWLFDVEILARLQRQTAGDAPLAIEVPLAEWRDVAGSRLGWLQMAAAPIGLWKIRQRYRS